MLSDHVTIARRFQRSIRLDSDLGRSDALDGSSANAQARMARQHGTQIAGQSSAHLLGQAPMRGKSSLL